MAEKYIIGIDIGTQGTKTVLYDVAGKSVDSAFEASNLIYPQNGAVEQDPDEIYGSVLRTVKSVIEKTRVDPSDIEAVGMDGQMAGMLGVDRDLNPTTPLDSWLDRRCEPYIDLVKNEAEEKVISLTGCPVTYAHGPKILRWKSEYSDVYGRTDKYVEPVTYAVLRLCGKKADEAYIDYTNLHFSGFADNEKLEWSDELLGLFGVEKSKMPEIVEPYRIIGMVTEEAARQCLLSPGTPVVAGCGDQAATSLGAGVVLPGECFDGAGTASVFSVCTTEYKPDVCKKTLLFPHHVLPGLYQPMAYISGGGLCLKWFRDSVLDGRCSYRELEEEADKIPPGSDGLFFIPHFNGRTCPNDPKVRGMFWGLGFTHGKGAIFKSIMESIAYEYRMYADILGIGDIGAVIGTGGGSASPCFNRIKADVLGTEYRVTTRSDTATFGSALLAGYGVGIYGDLVSTAKRLTSVGAVYEQNEKKHAIYVPYAEKYADLLEKCGILA
ncbi:MAG: xylulose kinase [Clostridia bacterium]|nr:xylulose kinase [Clostridia bacterium]MBR5768446.1 xylulose kinase [Clostridia bacterium]